MILFLRKVLSFVSIFRWEFSHEMHRTVNQATEVSKCSDGEPTSPSVNDNTGHFAPPSHLGTMDSHGTTLIRLDDPVTETMSHEKRRGSSITSTRSGAWAGS